MSFHIVGAADICAVLIQQKITVSMLVGPFFAAYMYISLSITC